MNDKLKIIIYVRDVVKPIVFTCSESKSELVEKVNKFLEDDFGCICFESGDFFKCNKSDLRAITITVDKND